MKEVLTREYDLLGKTRLSHIWHMTVDKEDNPDFYIVEVELSKHSFYSDLEVLD